MLALLVLLSLLLTETDLCKKKKKCSIFGTGYTELSVYNKETDYFLYRW